MTLVHNGKPYFADLKTEENKVKAIIRLFVFTLNNFTRNVVIKQIRQVTLIFFFSFFFRCFANRQFFLKIFLLHIRAEILRL